MKILRKKQPTEYETALQFLQENYNIALTFVVPSIAAGTSMAMCIFREEYIVAAFIAAFLVTTFVFIGYLRNHNHYLFGRHQPKRNKQKLITPDLGRQKPAIPRNKSLASQSYNFVQSDSLHKLKYCYTCKIFRPHLAVHCARCDECCLEFDHHCMWLQNCICSGNYKAFVAFLLVLLALSILVITSIATQLGLAGEITPVDAILGSIGFLAAVLILVFDLLLMGFHLFLRTKGLNTYQYIKRKYKQLKGAPAKPQPIQVDGKKEQNVDLQC
jgi:hypothetical protein